MYLVRPLALLMIWLAFTSSAVASELIMFRRDGCSYCAVWDRDIGLIYGKSDLGGRAPLRMVDIHRDRHGVSLASPVIYTPTFVLVDKGREIGRIEGYPGPDFFWGLLERLLRQLPPGAASGLSVTPLSQPTSRQ